MEQTKTAEGLTVSVVIPARNEARNLEEILPELPEVHEVILVDGGSHDDTVDVSRRVMPEIKVVHQTRKGKGNALACGFKEATGDVIVMFDADGSADPAEIPHFVAALAGGADFAKGSRFIEGGGSHDITRLRAAGNWCLNALTNTLIKTQYTDLCYGYNAFRRGALQHMDLPSTAVRHRVDAPTMQWGDGFEIETVINCRVAVADLKVSEVPSVEKLRRHGDSNLNAVSDGLRVLKTIFSEARRARRVRRQPPAVPVQRTAPAAARVPVTRLDDVVAAGDRD